jgi:hypothetical protein
MTEFIDPRSNPEPPARVTREPAAHGEELRDLVALCRMGRAYDVERWIHAGRPIQALTYARPRKPLLLTPLRSAIRTRHRDVVLLLLCNGYRLDLETEDWRSVVDEALEFAAFDILELLLQWGADPTKVRTENVVDTYRSELIDRFWRSGVDFTADPGFVDYLAHRRNKPLLGWLRRNRSDPRLQDALDVALREAVEKDEELPVSLLLWAGADPHRKVPPAYEARDPGAWGAEDRLTSSAEAAIWNGRHRMFDRLRVRGLPELGAYARCAPDASTLKLIIAASPPADWSETILAFIRRLCWNLGSSSREAREALKVIESSGGRLCTAAPDELRYLRSQLLDLSSSEDFLWLVRWLKKEKHCDAIIFSELTWTAAMREKLKALEGGERYVTPAQKMSRANERRRRAKERAEKSLPERS